jgi:L-lactate utilization protein LutC
MTTLTKKTTLKELQQQAKGLGIAGYSKLSKSELEAVIGKARNKKAKRTVTIPTTLEEAQQTLGRLDKGNARKLRKLLRKRGLNTLAAAKREVACIQH